MAFSWNKYKSDYLQIIKLGLPMLVGQLGMIVVGFADNIMVGRYSTDALASASFVNNVFNLAIFACLGFTFGLTPLVGALFSQSRFERIGAMLRSGLVVNLLFALTVTAIMLGVYACVGRMGQPEELMPLIKPYFLLCLAGIVPVVVFNVLGQWLNAINRTAVPMWIVLVANALNIAGNYVLIFGNCGMPEMGLIGAGWATLASRILCPVVAIALFCMHHSFRPYFVGFRTSRFDRSLAATVARTSWPVSAQMTLETAAFSGAVIMAGWLGAVSLAAYQIIAITGTLGFCIYASMASAVCIIVSNRAGLNDCRGMRRGAFAGYHIILLMAMLSSLLFIFFEKDMIHAFTEDEMVIATTITLIFPLVLYQLGDATQMCFANALRGTSHVMPMLWIALVAYVVIGLPSTYLLAFPAGLGIYGIILSFTCSLFPAAGGFLYFFIRRTRCR